MRKNGSRLKNCKICGQSTRDRYNSRGRCSRCNAYWRRHGVERPVDLKSPKTGKYTHRLCTRCKRDAIYAKDLCRACYAYRYKHGKPRPARLFREFCFNCQRPLNDVTCNRYAGYCNTCYAYLRKYNHKRPKSAIDRYAPLGWCDCGEPAIRIVEYDSYYIPDNLAEPIKVCITCADGEIDEETKSNSET